MLKLNLGCGGERLAGYLNVDKLGEPELVCDLEVLPWPWAEGSVGEVRMHHVLEHLGQAPSTYLGILKELYRVCAHQARVVVTVPHPRHDDYLSDPTHVRPITAESFTLYSKRRNLDWAKRGVSNSPLALVLDIDFEIETVNHTVEPTWLAKLKQGELKPDELMHAATTFHNVIKQTEITLRVIKG